MAPRPKLAIGDVVLVFDRDTIPPKPKRHICICPERHFFLRINTKPLFWPCHMLRKANNAFLDHDSYVELTQLVRHLSYDVAKADVLGRLTRSEGANLVRAVDSAETLSEAHKAVIRERLSTLT